jgi:hypothetical protein
MLVNFRSDAGNMTMFGDVAVQLLRMMGQSGGLPGALLAADMPAALERLERAAAVAPEPPGDTGSREEGEPKVSLRQRAFPLIELLGRCVQKKCDLIWEQDQPMFPGKAR